MSKNKTNLTRAQREGNLKFLKNPETVKKILFTLMILAIYRIGSAIPVPGVDTTLLRLSLENNSVFGLMNMLGGGSLERLSIFAMGVGPYITGSIIVQLLSMEVIPALDEMRKEGKKGQEKLNNITKYVGLALALVQGFSLIYGFDKQYGILPGATIADYLFIVVILTAGTMTLVWFGDQIAMKGVGNGLSMIIFAGIVANIPTNIINTYNNLLGVEASAGGIATFIAYLVFCLLIIVLVLVMELSSRRIPVQYAGRLANGSNINYLPFKINSASVLPVIFASSVLSAPQIILSFVNADAYRTVSNFLNIAKFPGLLIYAALIVFFSFFYTDLQMEPDEIAKNLNKNHAFIPGVRAGGETNKYIKDTLHNVTVYGTIALLIIALIPYIMPMITSLPENSGIGGTGIIIAVSVALETIKQLQAEDAKDKYSDYVKGGIF